MVVRICTQYTWRLRKGSLLPKPQKPPSSRTSEPSLEVPSPATYPNTLVDDLRESPLSISLSILTTRIVMALCYTACWIPLWILPDSFGGLAAGGFFIQSGVQGAWGVVPIYLGEISPPAFRASFGGLAYQLGNMASSAAAQIEATAGESLKLKGTTIPDYVSRSGDSGGRS